MSPLDGRNMHQACDGYARRLCRVWPRKDGLGTPSFLGFFYSYILLQRPTTLNTNTTPSMGLLCRMLGAGLVLPNFGVFFETPFWPRTPQGSLQGTPPFLARKGVLWGAPRQEPSLPSPFLQPF